MLQKNADINMFKLVIMLIMGIYNTVVKILSDTKELQSTCLGCQTKLSKIFSTVKLAQMPHSTITQNGHNCVAGTD